MTVKRKRLLSLGKLALVSPDRGVHSFGPKHVTLGDSVEQTAAAMICVMVPFQRGAGREWYVTPCVRLHVQASILQIPRREYEKRAL